MLLGRWESADTEAGDMQVVWDQVRLRGRAAGDRRLVERCVVESQAREKLVVPGNVRYVFK